jgi:protein-S-isoprenylcysteine O-methyltransferase Ste14
VGSMLRTSTMRGRLYVCTVYPYLFVLYYLRFPRDLQFRVIHICVFSMIMALRKKCVRTLHDRLKIIHEVEKKVCHLYWKVMNHAMYTSQTRRGYSSCFLKEPWRIKEKLAMEENIPKTDSLCYCVLTPPHT